MCRGTGGKACLRLLDSLVVVTTWYINIIVGCVEILMGDEIRWIEGVGLFVIPGFSTVQ